ncbi:hypothetical protein NQ317_009592 [Molorchus minor]|uniref:Uncharacterized protein n=1 Tax=Molorchus minor TaxID=1323400 RepID=A0ABQ9J7R9_9CUCU|nr:hypothetical protein NQ317_009592 [Molorchus minor]
MSFVFVVQNVRFLKRIFAEELTVTMSNIVTNIKPHTVSQPSCYHSRKSKGECPKRTRKLPTLIAEPLIE